MASSRAISTRRSAIDSDKFLEGPFSVLTVVASVFAFFAPPPFFLAKTFAGNLSSGVSFVKNSRAALSDTVPPHLRPNRDNSDLSSSPLTSFSRSDDVAYLLRSIPIALFEDLSSDGEDGLSDTIEASAIRHSHPSTPPFSPHSFSKDAMDFDTTSLSTFKKGVVRFRNPVRYFSNSRRNRAYLRRSRNLADSEIEVLSPLSRMDRKSR
mmetsp:Transcript_18660/g.32083  ORF Transcript_18660/g.32083 Transcript_18660/m.32083 type:complete len:209 (+) Transcript_18660:1192-1818(+)